MFVGRLTLSILLAAALVISVLARIAPRPAAAASGRLSVDATSAIGTVTTQLSTQLVYAGILEETPGAQQRLSSYAPPLVRIHAGTDGCCWAGGPAPGLPGGVTRGDWHFR